MKKIVSFILAAIAIAGCSKDVRVSLDHPVEVELPPDVAYESESLLYVNISEETAVDFASLGRYVSDSNPDVLLAIAGASDREVLVSGLESWGYGCCICSDASEGSISLIASKNRFKASARGGAWAAASLSCCSAVVGLDSGTLMEETAGFDGRIYFLSSSSDPSGEYYRKTFCNCIAAQWGTMMPTSVTSRTDYLFARPSQWSNAGAVSMDRESPWKHYPMSFTIRKEQ